MDALVHLKRLHGLACRDFKLIAWGTLILYVGDWDDEHSRTEWRIHLEPAWRLDGPAGPIVGSFDVFVEEGRPADWVFQKLGEVAGKTIEEIGIAAPTVDLRIGLSGGLAIGSFADSAADGERWEFRHRSGLRVAMRGATVCGEYWEDADRPA